MLEILEILGICPKKLQEKGIDNLMGDQGHRAGLPKVTGAQIMLPHTQDVIPDMEL